MRIATRFAEAGIDERNEASEFVDEYIDRLRLAKIGITSPLGEMPAFKVEAFLVIAQKIDEIREAKAEAGNK